MTKIGIIGTGMLGEAVGLHLIDVGYDVIVFNRTKEKTKKLEEKGARVGDSPKQVAENSDLVITIVKDADAVMTLRLQKERMRENLLTDLHQYHCEYGITHESLKWCKKAIPVLHPGPVNRGIEMSSALLEDSSICLAREQVKNGIPIRMDLLYLLAAKL